MGRRTVRLATIAVVLGGVLVLGAGAAQAHPLGNFTINLYDGLTVGPHGIDLDHVTDMARSPPSRNAAGSTPTGTDRSTTRSPPPMWPARAPMLPAGSRSPSKAPSSPCGPTPPAPGPPAWGRRSFHAAARCSLHADAQIRPGARIAFRDDADPGRIGWHEVTAAGVA